MKKFVYFMLDALRFIIGELGFFFGYTLIIYVVTDGAIVGRLGWVLTAVGSAASALWLDLAIRLLGVNDNA
jgi:hypothetical protein